MTITSTLSIIVNKELAVIEARELTYRNGKKRKITSLPKNTNFQGMEFKFNSKKENGEHYLVFFKISRSLILFSLRFN